VRQPCRHDCGGLKVGKAKSHPVRSIWRWSASGKGGRGTVGNAYPLLNLTTGEVVADPPEEFPNPGAVFLNEPNGPDNLGLHPD